MINKAILSEKNMKDLSEIINQLSGIDFRKINLQDPNTVKQLNEKRSAEINEEVLELLKAYQRIIRILPDNYRDHALNLVKVNILSAVQIASLPRSEFIAICKEECNIPNDVAAVIYNNALAKKSNIVVQYIKSYQHDEPHIKNARFR
jgi:hypothetical protein